MPVVAIQWTRERIMNRPTDVQRLRKFLEAWPGQKISMAKLKVELDSRRNWPGEKVERVVEKAIADPKMCISHGKSGNVEFTGSERASDPLLYRQVARILSTSWAVEQKLKDTTPYFTAHGGHRGAMDWLHPDVVVTGRGKKRFPSDDGRRWHSFEVERQGGFQLNSIFQLLVGSPQRRRCAERRLPDASKMGGTGGRGRACHLWPPWGLFDLEAVRSCQGAEVHQVGTRQLQGTRSWGSRGALISGWSSQIGQ
jgi:hypothetical protein